LLWTCNLAGARGRSGLLPGYAHPDRCRTGERTHCRRRWHHLQPAATFSGRRRNGTVPGSRSQGHRFCGRLGWFGDPRRAATSAATKPNGWQNRWGRMPIGSAIPSGPGGALLRKASFRQCRGLRRMHVPVQQRRDYRAYRDCGAVSIRSPKSGPSPVRRLPPYPRPEQERSQRGIAPASRGGWMRRCCRMWSWRRRLRIHG
jgi:hypothetical protein